MIMLGYCSDVFVPLLYDGESIAKEIKFNPSHGLSLTYNISQTENFLKLKMLSPQEKNLYIPPN